MILLTKPLNCITICNTINQKINMLTIRLDKKTEKDIDDMAKHLQVSKSDLVRECIAQYIVNFEKASAWELGEDKFGKYASGKGNLSKDRKTLLTKIIQKKRA